MAKRVNIYVIKDMRNNTIIYRTVYEAIAVNVSNLYNSNGYSTLIFLHKCYRVSHK